VGSKQLDDMVREYIAKEEAEGRNDTTTRLGGHYVTGLRYLLMADACTRAFVRSRMTRKQVVGLVAAAHTASHLSSDEGDELQATVGAIATYGLIVEGQESLVSAALRRYCK
jgi:hypothetical protein